MLLHRSAECTTNDTSQQLIAAAKSADGASTMSDQKLTQLRLILLMRCLEHSMTRKPVAVSSDIAANCDGLEAGANLTSSGAMVATTVNVATIGLQSSEGAAITAAPITINSPRRYDSADGDKQLAASDTRSKLRLTDIGATTDGGATLYASARSTCEAGAPATPEQRCSAASAASVAPSTFRATEECTKPTSLRHKLTSSLKLAFKGLVVVAGRAAHAAHPRTWCGSCVVAS
jgi:hypothetical protein